MPRHPAVAPTIAGMQGGVFSRLAHRILGLKGEIYPLHVGDTWMDPAVGARMEDLRTRDLPGLHRYTRPVGHPRLVAAASRHWDVAPERVLISAGATGGLAAAAGALLSPGDEVLILAPFWPLIPGIVAASRGVPVQVPFYGHAGSVVDRLAPFVTDRTVAVYINTPSNPTGQVLSAAELAEVAAVARQHGLWIWSDEVYEDYVYEGQHLPMRHAAPERTITALSFSKAWGMAGNRCGVVLTPEDSDLRAELRKVSIHQVYSASTASQIAAALALESDGAWVRTARERYQRAGEATARALGVAAPHGGTFVFLDVSEHLDTIDEDGLHGFLVRCIDRGLLLAPGSSCGDAYAGCVRVCFTSASPDVVARGVAVLAQLLGRA